MDETGVLGLIEELSILLEDSKPVFGKNNLRQVDINQAFEIMDEIRETFPGEFAQARQIVRERRIPLSLSYDVPNDETIAALREGAEILATGGTGQSFSSGRDLLDAAYKA